MVVFDDKNQLIKSNDKMIEILGVFSEDKIVENIFEIC